MWVWFAVGVGVFALVVVLAFVRTLGTIGREVAELHETQMWADWPTSPKRMSKSGTDSRTDMVAELSA